MKGPIVIVGCGHSGTSVLLAALGSHSEIFAVPQESSFGFMNEREAKKSLLDFSTQAAASEKRRWAEKTPKHIHKLERIFSLVPDAKVVIMLRDGRDVACSIRDRTGSLIGGIQRWVTDNTAGLPYWDDPRVHVVRYEDLVAHFEATMRNVMVFLKEEYEQEIRMFHKDEKKWYSNKLSRPPSSFGEYHNQYRNWQINQPLFDGRGRWKKLTADEYDSIETIGKDLLTKLGYI